MFLQISLLEIKTKEPPNKYLMYLLLKPKSHMTSSSTQSKQYHAQNQTKEPSNKYLMYLLLEPKSHKTSSSTIWEDPWVKASTYVGGSPKAKASKLFVVLSIYKTSIYILWWTKNIFLGGQIITFLVDKEYIPS
jgi:hypothetical protein